MVTAGSNWYAPFLNEPIFLGRDGSQMEIRMLGQYSKDKLLCRQLNSGEDIHSQVGNTIYGWPVEKIKKDKRVRTVVKGLHFGIIFGLKPAGIVEDCLRQGVKPMSYYEGMPLDEMRIEMLVEIEEAYAAYFTKYVGVAQWRDEAIEYARKHRKTMPTLFGRERELVIDDSGESKGAFWANQAVNTPIQGSASDFLVLALAIAWEHPEEYKLVLDTAELEIHDSFVCAPLLRQLAAADAQLEHLMGTAVVEEAKKKFGVDMLVPLVSEASAGFRFGSMVDYDRKKPLSEMLDAWVKKDEEIEKAFVKNPLQFVDVSRR